LNLSQTREAMRANESQNKNGMYSEIALTALTIQKLG